ncbi:hypothetical protein [Methylocapsa palsarum]|uniref:Uncharacterized protein n=1 Tax=Methylocapsa palsarum TaxID=1612308 RepID=A0A1I4ASC1_9HYPH|nr:hypothetical protein [Methylocapsa palsarum]SFK58857.1 hypothetical protein SAMN05444581_11158 [Methylocapsa palsarum]
MHDIDRIRLETSSESGLFESGPFEAEQFEFGEAEGPTFGEFGEAEVFGEMGETFGETEQLELASELLEITSEAELDRFLGDLIAKAGQAVGGFIRSPEGQAIGGILKGAAKQALPGIGSAVGGYFGGAQGARLGRDAAQAAGRAFGLELEGLSGEDRDFEIARRYVNFAGEAVKNLAFSRPGSDPSSAARAAAVEAAKTYAPGLLSRAGDGVETGYSRATSGRSGRWMRRGNKIVLYGI